MVEFMSSTAGRITRAAIGVVLLVVAFITGGVWAWVLGILGAVFVTVGVADVCLLAPLFGKPLKGADVRASLH
ncbi:MAG TPA: DUF2892 domain-containing protein [Arachnia sp.]|nr:DUF2892 domain-containing protein [Arachnia sp.]